MPLKKQWTASMDSVSLSRSLFSESECLGFSILQSSSSSPRLWDPCCLPQVLLSLLGAVCSLACSVTSVFGGMHSEFRYLEEFSCSIQTQPRAGLTFTMPMFGQHLAHNRGFRSSQLLNSQVTIQKLRGHSICNAVNVIYSVTSETKLLQQKRLPTAWLAFHPIFVLCSFLATSSPLLSGGPSLLHTDNVFIALLFHLEFF